jgi:adenylate kinase
VIIFMGVAGAGKSVQGRRVADEFGYPWLSTGEFLRMLVSGQPRLDMIKGKLLGDKEIIRLVQKIFNLIDLNTECILDGFPRTTAQADWLLNQHKYGQLNISAVIHLKASEEVVMKRLLSRARQDDTEEAIRARFKEYEQAALPVIEQFKEAGVSVYDIDGNRTVEEVHHDIVNALKKDGGAN